MMCSLLAGSIAAHPSVVRRLAASAMLLMYVNAWLPHRRAQSLSSPAGNALMITQELYAIFGKHAQSAREAKLLSL
jgi:hypothetical protein